MLKVIAAAICWLLFFIGAAHAQTCTLPISLPYTLTNGNNADATQVMADLNALLNCVNNPPAPPTSQVPRSYIAGLTLSTPGSSTSVTVAAGQATESTNASTLTLASALTKTTLAWAVGTGSGGLDTGSIAMNTWYHVYLIKRPDTGVVDALFSLNATSPTLPTNYTLFRRIGSVRTNASSQWTSFTQAGDLFELATPVADLSASNPGTTAFSRTLPSVPLGVNVLAQVQIMVTSGGSQFSFAYVSDLATADMTPSSTFADTGQATYSASVKSVRTNTSQQVRTRNSYSDGSTVLTINTLGWIDRRGKDN